MSKTLTAATPPPRVEGLAWQAGSVPPAAAFQPNYRPLLERDRQLRLAQAARLAAARANLAAAIYDATALAALRLGALHDWDLHLPPDQSPAGPDVTEQIRSEIRSHFDPRFD